MASLWQDIRHLLGLSGDGPALDEALHELVSVAEPKLALLSGWESSLKEGARTSLAYAQELASAFATPLDLSPQGYNADPRVGLLFANPEVLSNVLNGSGVLRDFFLHASNGDEAYGLLVMQCHERPYFGRAMRNGQLVSDVAQTIVSFTAHHLIGVCASEDALRVEAAKRVFHAVAAVAARRIALLGTQQQAMSTEKLQIELKLATLSGAATVIDAIPGSEDLPATREALEARLAEIKSLLPELNTIGSLEGKLQVVRKVSMSPSDFVSAKRRTLLLDRMGVIRSQEEGEEGVTLDIETMTFGRLEPIERVVMPFRVTRQALEAWRERLA